MSLKSLLMPAFSERLLSQSRLQGRRARAERRRVARGEPHRVYYFHQVDDPYSALACALLPALLARYDIALQAHVVGAPPDAAAPERALLVAYSRKDAQLLAARAQLAFTDPGAQPTPQRVQRATRILVAACRDGRFSDIAADVSASLWCDGATLDGVEADAAELTRHLAGADALRMKLGHYLGAMFHYAGEWYWGVDRLHHLERRLQELGAQRTGVGAGEFLFAPPELATPTSAGAGTAPARIAPDESAKPSETAPNGSARPRGTTPPIDFFFSLRSPYSAIVAPRVFALGERLGAEVKLRYLLPMVMRGLPVPFVKRMYIVRDAAREARLHGQDFGRLNDPVGRPTERGLALIPLAERAGVGQAYVCSFMRGVWAEGIDAGSDRGLRKIVERCGLDWQDASAALHDEAWRIEAEQNRQDLFALGLWGVPAFRVGDTAVWGQDRLWAVEQALRRAGS